MTWPPAWTKWVLLALLVLTAPAPVVAFESFVTGPLLFVLAQLLYMLADSAAPGSVWHPHIIGFFVVHLAMYGFGYFIIAWAIARLAHWTGPRARRVLLSLFVLAVGALAFAPVYGGGGIFGGMRGSLFYFFTVLETTHFGPAAALKLYGPALAVLGLFALWRWRPTGRLTPRKGS